MPEIGEDALSHELTESIGPWPFTTRRTYVLPDFSRAVWRSREALRILQKTSETRPHFKPLFLLLDF